MNPMAVSYPADDGSVKRGRSVKNRQVSVYASRIKASVTPLTITGLSPESSDVEDVPQLPPLPISPRWDSLSNGTHILLATPGTPNPQGAPNDAATEPQPQATPHIYPDSQPLDAAVANIAHDSANSVPNSPLEPPSRPPTAKSSLADLRAHDSGGPIENFSRPRKQSIKHPALELGKPSVANGPPADLLQEIANSAPQTPPWQRSRGPSVSSNKSSSTFASPVPPPAADVPEPRIPKARNAPGTPLPNVRPPYGNTRVDSSASAPVMGGTAPWMGGDELRSSFRSQLTSSTAPGTALTERSSVLTKDSSVSSLYANADADADTDEPSLEDVMGMYEKGFEDDEGLSESEDNLDSRPMTAMSEPGPRYTAMGVRPADEAAPPVPSARIVAAAPAPAPSSLDAEIRQSKMIFTSAAFTSSVPAISNNLEVVGTEKRDSARSLASDPSVASEPMPNTTTNTTSNPPTSASASPSPYPSPPPSVSPLPFSVPQAEHEDPGSRDRYGFKKKSQFITKDQYDTWNKGYSQYLARRRRKWIGYLRDSSLMTDRPIRFPPPNAKTKRFVRKGIPPDWRGAAWFYYAGGPAILAKHSGLYEKLLYKKAKQIDAEAIERDLHRTFPDNIQFKPSPDMPTAVSSERASQSTMTGSTSGESIPGPPAEDGEPPIITSLRRVLHAFSVYNPKIGYCQSLNFLAGLLLLFVETEEQCFWLLNVITRIYLPGTHEMSLEGSKVDLGVLMTEIRDTMPAVWDKIGGELEGDPTGRPTTSKSLRRPMPMFKRKDVPGLSTERLPPITLCMTAWFMSCFIGTLPIETTLRVWDVFFYEGSKTMFRIALSIFKLGEAEIKAVSDPMEMFGVVQSMPRRMLDANALMEACFKRRNGFNHLNQDTIEELRQGQRDKTQVDRELHLQRGKAATINSNMPPSSAEVHKKNTLFGMKKRDASRTRPAEA